MEKRRVILTHKLGLTWQEGSKQKEGSWSVKKQSIIVLCRISSALTKGENMHLPKNRGELILKLLPSSYNTIGRPSHRLLHRINSFCMQKGQIELSYLIERARNHYLWGMDTSDQSIFGKEVIDFARVGVEFASLLENCLHGNKRDFVDRAVKILPLLYLHTQLLPAYDYDQETDYAPVFVGETMYDDVRNSVEQLLGEDNSFLTTLHQDMQYSDTPIGASLGECLADVYQQVVDLLGNIREAEEYTSIVAIGRAKFYFIDYWGERLLATLGPLHRLHCSLLGDDTTDEEPYREEPEQ